MFGGRFSLQRFSLRGDVALEANVTATYTETMRCLISGGGNAPTENNFRCTVKSDILSAKGIGVTPKFAENIHADIQLLKNVFVGQHMKEELECHVRLSSNIDINVSYMDDLRQLAYLGKNTQFALYAREAVEQSAFLGKNLYAAHNYRESVFGVTSANILTREMFIIDINIPPGGELRIDSETFTVTLNGEDILYLHSGDWIEIDKNAVFLQVSTGSMAQIDGLLLYTERFL